MKTFKQYLAESVIKYKVFDVDSGDFLGRFDDITQAENASKGVRKYKNYLVLDHIDNSEWSNGDKTELNNTIKHLQNQGHKDLSVVLQLSDKKYKFA